MDFEYGQDLPAKFDFEVNDYRKMCILLQYKNSFEKAIKMYSADKSRIADVIPIFSRLRAEVSATSTRIGESFGQDT